MSVSLKFDWFKLPVELVDGSWSAVHGKFGYVITFQYGTGYVASTKPLDLSRPTEYWSPFKKFIEEHASNAAN